MNRYSFFILMILLGLPSAAAADTGVWRGVVYDAAAEEPIAGVVVQALDSNGKVKSFASTNSSGVFELECNARIDSLSFRSMGYEARRLHVSYNFADGVRLTPKSTHLKNVIVKAPDIYAKGDTLVFNIAQYADAKDNAIIDVIKRLPGIRVEEDGTIKYQGRPINKFYIDGNDFIDSQYGLAVGNISHEDVKSVEVMENHQPVKALEGIDFPEEAGINLKLKEDARSKWVGVAKAAAGAEPFQYDGSAYAMRIASRMQNVATLRAGNTAWNPASQITEHDFYDMSFTDYSSSLWPEYISADIVSAPLTDKRTRDNLSWFANAISAWKRGDNSMRLIFNYAGDRIDCNSSLKTDYFNPSIPDFVQNNGIRTQKHDLSLRFNSEINRRDYYLKDRLEAKVEWNDVASVVTGSMSLGQNVSRRNVSASNDLKLVKRDNKRIFELISHNSLLHSPNILSLSGGESASQSVDVTDFRSTTEVQCGKFTRFWKFYISGGVDLNWHRMNNRLTGLGSFDNSGVTNAVLSKVYATPRVDFGRNNWRLSMSLPVKWLHQSINGSRDYVNLAPSFSVNKKTSAKSELSLSASYALSSPQPYLEIPAPVLADYRNLFIGRNYGKYVGNVSSGIHYRYRNPLRALFFNASAAYKYSRSSLMANQLFIGELVISTFVDRLSESGSWTLSTGISKGLAHGRMAVGCDLSASTSAATSMRDNIECPYRQFTANARPYFKGSVLSCVSLNYEANYSFSRLKVENSSNAYHSLNQNLNITVMPSDFFHVTVGAGYFLTHFPEGNNANLVLIDASAVWRINGEVWLELMANNLLDKRSYEYVTYGILSRSEHVFRLRRRNILATVQYRF